MPVRTIEKYGDEWIKPQHIVSNGAYTLKEWRINDRIRLEKNPYYWNAANVALETVDILPVSKANVAFNFFSSGVADVLLDKGLAPPPARTTCASSRTFTPRPSSACISCASTARSRPLTTCGCERRFPSPSTNASSPGKSRGQGSCLHELRAARHRGYTSPTGPGFDPERARASCSPRRATRAARGSRS